MTVTLSLKAWPRSLSQDDNTWLGPARDHVQQPGCGRLSALPVDRCQINDDGDKAGLSLAARVFPLVFIDTDDLHPIKAVRIVENNVFGLFS